MGAISNQYEIIDGYLNADQADILQKDILSSKTANNTSMAFNATERRNTGLNPEYFTGDNTRIVNALNATYKFAKGVEGGNELVKDMIKNSIGDVTTSSVIEAMNSLKEATGKLTLIEMTSAIQKDIKDFTMVQANKPLDSTATPLTSLTIDGKGYKFVPEIPQEVTDALETIEGKQDKLTAGENIKIEDGVISAEAEKLEAGENIKIEDGVISAVVKAGVSDYEDLKNRPIYINGNAVTLKLEEDVPTGTTNVEIVSGDDSFILGTKLMKLEANGKEYFAKPNENNEFVFGNTAKVSLDSSKVKIYNNTSSVLKDCSLFYYYGNYEVVINDFYKDFLVKKPTVVVGTLEQGNSVIEFTCKDLNEDSIVDVYTDIYGVSPDNLEITGNKVKITFSEQEKDMKVKLVVANY